MTSLRTLALAGVAALAATGAAGAQTVSIGVQPWLGYGPLWVAAEKGYFEENGVDAELVNFTWDQDMSAALASGNVNIMSAATNTMISLLNTGTDIKAFLILDAAFEADAILAPEEVDSIADLKGLSVAYERGATSDLLLNYALRENDMSIEDIEPVQMAAADAGLALIAGQVDVAVTYEPYISAALAQGENHKVLYTAAERPGLISDVLIAETGYIEENPEIIQGVIRAWDQAVQFIEENPDEGGKIIADAVGSGMEEFQTAFEGVRLYDLEMNVEALQGEYQEAFTTIGEIMADVNPDEISEVPSPDEVIDTSGVEAVAE